MPGGKYREDRPSAHSMTTTNRDDLTEGEQERRQLAEKEYEALRERQQALAEARQDEDVPLRWDDWREPETMSLDELMEATDRLKEEVGGQDDEQHRT